MRLRLRILFILGLLLCIPAVFVLDEAFSSGPASWAVDQKVFWGTPVASFVFWIGLAHAGTFLSAILCALNIRWQRRIAFPAEISTVAALGIAGLFPLIHLGIPARFYFLFPLGVARHLYVNIQSPLVWDFISIGVYFFLSLCFLVLHVLVLRFPRLEAWRRPFAWILFPLVLWVHTIVSLDFAVTQIPVWQGAWLPLYFIAGALFSGIALVLILSEVEGRRVQRLEELLLSFSWAMLAFWIWALMTRGLWAPEILVMGFLVPQLLWIPFLRRLPVVRIGIAFCVMAALWWERMRFVLPSSPEWTWIDYGWILLGLGGFMALFFGLRLLSLRVTPEEEPPVPCRVARLSRRRVALCWGIGAGVVAVFAIWYGFRVPETPLVRMVPVLFPLVALVAGILLFAQAVSKIAPRRALYLSLGLTGIAAGVVCAALYEGPETELDTPPLSIAVEAVPKNPRPAAALWQSRCASCHGEDGRFNRKFVHEFFPLPQKLTLSRLDSLGTDSLAAVILNGRGFMNPHRDRVSEAEARALVEYMRSLAGRRP